MKVYVNGRLYPKAKACVSVFDHGLLYGDGVFEGIRAYNGRVFRLDEHLERLENSARAIMLRVPLGREGIQRALIGTLRANNLRKRDAYIRLVVTRGVGDLGLDPRKCRKETLIIIAGRIALYPEKFYRRGLAVMTVATRRNTAETVNPRIKSLNYLNNILAKIEANNYGVLEAIMLNADGYVAECTGDNVFILRRGRLITPPLYMGALEGVTRNVVISLARDLGVPVAEEAFTRYDLYTAEECFLTGTAAEIVPVSNVDSRPIADGRPGPVTIRLIEKFREMTRSEGVPI
jgi:branched-chain amino acid aminotransferase